MNRLFVTTLLTSLALVSCLSTPGTVPAPDLKDTIVIVAERHDKYVVEKLDGQAETDALNESAYMVQLFSAAKQVNASAAKAAVTPVFARHDTFVLGDESLTVAEVDIYLQSTQLVMATIDEALNVNIPLQ